MSSAKAAIATTPSPQANNDRGYAASSYFHQQQQQQQQQHEQQQSSYHHGAPDVENSSNTYSNSQGEYGGHVVAPLPIRPAKFTEEWDASQRGSSIIDGPASGGNMQRSSVISVPGAGMTGDGTSSLSRGNTLRKKPSLRRSASLKRSGSRRSTRAGSVRSLALQPTTDRDEMHSAFYCPVPTAGSPTEVLANRFQAWRKILKDIITYFREIQTHYEHRAKSLIKLSNVLNNTTTPPGFLASGGLDDALQILRNYNKQAIVEANKAREIEEDVILALTGLRSDLHQKIKEIKNLAGDFKNTVEKEMDSTRRAVNQLQDVLGQAELDTALTTGKQDPYLLRLAVDRQLERQIDEENYLHQAYLNLENSGKELESIVVGEIQKAYNAYASILKRESDAAYGTIEELRVGPIAMPKDTEWTSFIRRDDRFVDPELPMRSVEFIHYPGRDHYACQEIRAGLLERKSKYLKSYTAGWYVLSPTHLHEYKSADKTQAPVMSLYLPEQKLGSHSQEGGSSNKFVLKGRQTGAMHRGHTWVFRAESHDTMMAWYDDIKTLTERTPEERNNLVRGNSRSFSRSSQRSSMDSDVVVDDEEDPPFAATVSSVNNQQPRQDGLSRRPSGGRFPSDLQVNAQRGLQVPISPLSVSSGYDENPNHDYLTARVSPGSQPSGQPQSGFQGTGQTARVPQDVFQQQSANLDGPSNEPSQFPKAVSPSNGSVFDGVDATKTYTAEAGHAWANPVPISLPVSKQPHQPTTPSPGSRVTREQALNSQTMGMTNGPSTLNRVESRGTEHREEGAVSETNGNATVGEGKAARPGAMMAVRTDSTPSVSHLHVPGEYPRGSVSAL